MTDRLYQEDSYSRSFAARITATRQTDAGWEITLDRTCFYPSGGGQPADHGTLDSLAVLDVQEEDGEVWHLLSGPPDAVAVHGEIDWPRRFDHMQQHTGQHILSAVLLRQLGAQTVSFHLGSDTVTIDVDRGGLSPQDAEPAEVECNRLIMDDIPVRTYFVSPAEVAQLNLRKQPTKGERTRIVEVAGLDLSPCGGTHVRSTGQIGQLKLRRLERYKGGTRIEFLCGWRALRDYQWKHQAVSALARDLSVADRDVQASVQHLIAGEKETRRQVEGLRGQLLSFEAQALRSSATSAGSLLLVVRAFPDRPPAEVKQLAGRLVAEPGTVALLAALDPSPRLFFMRSSDVALDMRELLRSVTQRCGGGGGGRPETAEGGGLPAARVAEALAFAAERAERGLGTGD